MATGCPSSQRPAVLPCDLAPTAGLLRGARWRGVRVRTLAKYLAAVSVGTLVLVMVSLNSKTVKEYIFLSSGQPITTPKAFSRRELRALHKTRRDAVQEVCQRNGISPNTTTTHLLNIKPISFRHIYVDDKHKFLWCSVPKVACTNFKRVLLILSGKVNTTNPADLASSDVHSKLERHLHRLNSYTAPQIRYRIRNYYKFMFVRDPLERILSAYVNKFTMHYNKLFRLKYGVKIIKKFRRRPTQHALLNGDDVTFNEFVRYLLKPAVSEPFNRHWLQFYKLCAPCVVQYDAIGKYETMSSDVDFVMDELGISQLISFPKGTAVNGKGKTTQLVREYYKKVPSELIHQLWELYSVDYSMFGYPYPDVLNDESFWTEK